MPATMRQLGLVQFFSWFALFSMWVFTTPAIAHHVYGCDISDTSSARYSEAQNWTGVIFGVYNLVSMFFALTLPAIAKRVGRRRTHAIGLLCGGLGLISIYFAASPEMLILSMVGVGVAGLVFWPCPTPCWPARYRRTRWGFTWGFLTFLSPSRRL